MCNKPVLRPSENIVAQLLERQGEPQKGTRIVIQHSTLEDALRGEFDLNAFPTDVYYNHENLTTAIADLAPETVRLIPALIKFELKVVEHHIRSLVKQLMQAQGKIGKAIEKFPHMMSNARFSGMKEFVLNLDAGILHDLLTTMRKKIALCTLLGFIQNKLDT
jgi:hypothetical protein